MARFFKPLILVFSIFAGFFPLSACSTNPATGESQFVALMSPQQENSIGAEEHKNILAAYGGLVQDGRVQDYVSAVGARLAKNTERTDVHYRFFVLDSPAVNAFSLPGGYVYVTRGILALANSESQLAAVLAHEIGHVTARHAAERYSRGVLSSLGASAVAMAAGGSAGSSAAAQVASLGSNLYLSAYSRTQESQADGLGIRYLYRAGYDPDAMAQFLTSLEQYSKMETRESGNRDPGFGYFSTHPQTADRVAKTRQEAATYPPNAKNVGRDTYLHAIDGVVYGDSNAQGFVRGATFWHPEMGFTFAAPAGYSIGNQPHQVVIRNAAQGVTALFDTVPNPRGEDAMTYLTHLWMNGEKLNNAENITINGKPAATATFDGQINKKVQTIMLVAVEWSRDLIFRFQIAMPPDAGAATRQDVRSLTRSLRAIAPEEMASIRHYRIRIVTAAPGDSIASLAAGSPMKPQQEERFRVLNGLGSQDKIVPGRVYKVIGE